MGFTPTSFAVMRTLSTAGVEHPVVGLENVTVTVGSTTGAKTQDLASQPMLPRLRPVVSNVKTRLALPNETSRDFTAGSVFGSPAILNRTSYS